MTRRRMPKRGDGGRFVPHAQRGSGERRPAGQPKRDNAPLGVTPHNREERPAGRRCEDCRTEMEERRVRIRGHVLYVLHCPRCCPDPLEALS